MGQLFRFEFRKLFRQKSFYICGCVLIGLILLTAVTLNMIYSLSQGNMEAGGVTVSASDDGFLYTGFPEHCLEFVFFIKWCSLFDNQGIG